MDQCTSSQSVSQILFCLTISVTVSGGVSVTPKARRSAVFEDVRPGVKLAGIHSSNYNNILYFDCAGHCIINPGCISVNWYKSLICELNFGDVYSLHSTLESDPTSTYVGMRKDEIVKCEEKGIPKRIQDDRIIKNFCQINRKRIDGQWMEGEEEMIVENSTAWTKVLLPECFEGSHGGKTCEGEGPVVTVEWIRGVASKMPKQTVKIWADICSMI